MGCLILCIGSLHSLLRCSVEFTVLIYFIVNTFHTPETKVMDILIQQIIDQLQCAGNILTAYSNCKSASGIECTTGIMPLVFYAFINCYRQWNIVASLCIQSCLLDGIACCVSEIPPLIDHTQDTSCRKLGNILIIRLGKGLGVYNAFLVFFI